ncbi:MAG: hypothetical protein R3C53_12290 [Pirellulaceae bacterium]
MFFVDHGSARGLKQILLLYLRSNTSDVMLQEPGLSPYDLQFNLLGFPVRVAWGFWIVAAVFGWGTSDTLDFVYASQNLDSPGAPILLMVWISVMFVSILVHELGHSLAMRYYGIHSRIVLYHFGGLAIPDSFASWGGARQRRVGPKEQIVISAAGPLLQLLLGLGALGIAVRSGFLLPETRLFDAILGTDMSAGLKWAGSASVTMLLSALVFTSVFWAILNLAPILPLDGGNITRSALQLSQVSQPIRAAHMVSVVAGGLIGLYFLSRGSPMAGIMFLIFAVNNWQAMQSGWGGY